jgi:hypothetical protein
MNKLTFGLLFGIISCGFFWVTGYDFDQRGESAAFCYIITTIFITAGIAAGDIIDNKNNRM